MTIPTFKRVAARGFTLIELLIVVIIVAILAAIAIPQFSSSTSDAQAAAMDADLASVRTAIEQYKVQHNSVYPGASASSLSQGASCPSGGTNKSFTAGTKEAMAAQLQYYSNAAGAVCDVGDPSNFKFGPYLRQGLPSEPITNSTAIVVTTTGSPIAPSAATGGWAYDTVSGQFVMNSNAMDTGNPQRAYSVH